MTRSATLAHIAKLRAHADEYEADGFRESAKELRLMAKIAELELKREERAVA